MAKIVAKPDQLPVVAMCSECRRGYVTVNPRGKRRCHACGGRIVDIEPVPNEWPYMENQFVRKYGNPK